jgi:hypothetical protein
MDDTDGIDLAQVEGSFEDSNEHSGSIRAWEFSLQVSNWRIFKKDSAAWS